MTEYLEYIQIGVVLKSPKPINHNYQYILKCVHDQYFELEESFMLPCIIHCDAVVCGGGGNVEDSDEKPEISYAIESNIEDDGELRADEDVKFEDAQKGQNMREGKDPLNLIVSKPFDSEPEDDKVTLEKQPSMEFLDDDVKEPKEEEDNEDELNNEMEIGNIEYDNESTASEDNTPSISAFIQNFIKSQENLILFIELYKQQDGLWNPNVKTKNLKKSKEMYLKEMRKDLKNQYQIDMTIIQIEKIIKYLHRRYQRSQEASKMDENPLNKRKEAIEEMLQTVNAELNWGIDEDQLKDYLQFIHQKFSKEKRLDIKNENCSQANNKKHVSYYKHMLFLYDHVGPFKCPQCNTENKNAQSYKIHKSQHDGSMPMKCSLCQKEFKVVSTYVLHARRHMNDLEDVCQECGKKFINSYDLRIHMRSHTGSKPFCCEICGVSFRHLQTFTCHKRRHEKNYLHHCPTCSKGFYSKGKLDDHIRSHKQIREFKCETCGKAFITKKTLQQHLVTHEDIRKFACSLCGKSFKLKIGLHQHMRTHGNQRYERPEEVV
ncbi:zinc finger protein 124-like [Musca vetustissima]|uniref:zinc finger protein 124-like n=1 Tax=Musca vetustissima TaxID=27455 RepID=UPI002AB607B3|nr:zinc finger protein 124-like [Musca vetustissima]